MKNRKWFYLEAVSENVTGSQTFHLWKLIKTTANFQGSQTHVDHRHVRKKRKTSRTKSIAEDTTPLTATFSLKDDRGDDSSKTGSVGTEYRQRLQSLSAFQFSLLRHAMRFPSAKRIVYSTCSTHWEENEGVVRRVLKTDECRKGGWQILKRGPGQGVLADWETRGLKMRDIAERCETEVSEEEDGSAVENGNICVRGVDNDDNDNNNNNDVSDSIAEACIRCAKHDGQGVMGFFVVAFVREDGKVEAEATAESECRYESNDVDEGIDRGDEEEWEGFSDD